MADAAYRVVVHRAAKSELTKPPADATDELTDIIVEASESRNPLEHPRVDPLDHPSDLCRVRVEGWRALCRLAKPDFQVLLVDKRRKVYDRVDVAERRAKDGGRR